MLVFGLVCMFLSVLLAFLEGHWELSRILPIYFLVNILLFTDKIITITMVNYPEDLLCKSFKLKVQFYVPNLLSVAKKT